MTKTETAFREAPIRKSPSAAPADEEPTIPLIGIALVLAIAGLLLFMAVPDRPLDAAAQAALRAEFDLRQALAEMRGAIGNYREDHGTWPGFAPGNDEPLADEDWFVRQLELFTDDRGRTVPRRLATHPHGPYLSRGVPANPFNGSTRVRILEADQEFPPRPSGHWGWIYSPGTGELRANVPGFLTGSGGRIFEL